MGYLCTGEFDIAKILLEHGADPNERASGGRTPLMGACSTRPEVPTKVSFKMLKLLLKQDGIDADAASNEGETALSIAAAKCLKFHYKALEAAGAQSISPKASGALNSQ